MKIKNSKAEELTVTQFFYFNLKKAELQFYLTLIAYSFMFQKSESPNVLTYLRLRNYDSLF